jgi:hypothetical protein
MMTQRERTIIRELARQVAEVASLPIQGLRRQRWKQHNSLQSTDPMLLVFPEGAWRELLPETALQCQDDAARAVERALRMRLYYHEHFPDDMVIENSYLVPKAIDRGHWGLLPRKKPAAQSLGSWTFDPVIAGPDDLKKLRYPVVSHDEVETARRLQFAQELLGDILEVRAQGVAHISFHLMAEYSLLRGLEQVMMDMLECPQMLHQAMAFFQEGNRQRIRQYVEMNLLELNNDSTYHSSGGNGYTDELPAAGFDPTHVRTCDVWASAESQELAEVSPQMHEEFATAYERPLLEMFALNGYGCCEDLTYKLDGVLSIPQIRRISISPWADVARCAERLGKRYILSWKPMPAMLCGKWDDQKIRTYVRQALDAARGCVLEIILKDTHTVDNEPWRMDRWMKIAREEIERAG